MQNKLLNDQINSDYIDIDFQIDIPIREIGKFNLEKDTS